MKKQTKKSEWPLLGEVAQDRSRIRQCLAELGWSQERLARESNLSPIMVRSFLNEKRNLSLAASERVLSALNQGYDEKRAIEEALQRVASDVQNKALSPETAERIRAGTNRFLEMSGLQKVVFAQQQEIAALEKINTSNKEIISICEEWIGRL